MLIRKPDPIRPSEITSRDNYLNRRQFIRAGAIAGASLSAPAALAAVIPDEPLAKLADIRKPSPFSTDETLTSYDDVTTYNNFYEFGTGKDDPHRNAQDFEPQPWSITVDGHAENTGTFHLEDFVKPHTLEERIYRMRCVEACLHCCRPLRARRRAPVRARLYYDRAAPRDVMACHRSGRHRRPVRRRAQAAIRRPRYPRPRHTRVRRAIAGLCATRPRRRPATDA